jgi:hypothetical protein
MPQQVRARFQRRVQNLLRDYGELLLAVHGKRRQASLESMLSEQATMSLGVYWEAFVHDLFLAYVTKNPVNCVADFKNRIDKSLASKFSIPNRWLEIRIPASLNQNQVAKMIDPKGWNIAATSAKELRDKANQLLHSTDARNFSLDADDAAFVDLLVSIRNYLAHRSTNSRTLLSSTIRQISAQGANGALAGNPVEAGLYLKTIVAAGDRRVHSVGHRLSDVAAKLAP